MNQSIKQSSTRLKQYLKTNVLFLTFVFTSVCNALLVRILTIGVTFSYKPLIADLAFVLVIGSFAYFFKPKHRFKYFFILGILFTAICVINSMYYTNYLSFASISLLSTSLQIVDVGDAITENVMELKDFCYLWQPAFLLLVHIVLKKKKYYDNVLETELSSNQFKYTALTGLAVMVVFCFMLTSENIERLSKPWNKRYIVSNFGIYTYQLNDIIYNITLNPESALKYDRAARETRKFYQTRDETKTGNKYENLFQGKNLLVIHAESMMNFLIDEEFNGIPVTPTLNQLAKEGMYFSNFHSQESVGTSSDSEFTFLTGMMPSASGTVFINYPKQDYVTIPKMLKEKGYYTFSMHGNKGTFWNREEVHASFGYDRFYHDENDFDTSDRIGLGISDKSFFHQVVPKIAEIDAKNKNWMGTLLMLSNHTPFSGIVGKTDYEVDLKYSVKNPGTGVVEEKRAPYLEGTILGNYIKSVNYADAAIGELISELKQAGLLENTILVIYGDHDSKLKPSEYERYYNYDPVTDSILDSNDPNYHEVNYFDYELNREVPLIIWDPNQNYQVEVTDPMGMYDVEPTLGNMFGFSSPFALGHDIFNTSDEKHIVVFPDGNWLTKDVYYNSQGEELYQIDKNVSMTNTDIKHYTEYAQMLNAVSNDVIVYNLLKDPTVRKR